MKDSRLSYLVGGAVLAMTLALPAGWSLAQGKLAGGTKFACVDVVKVFNDYQRQKDLTVEMEQLKANLQKENERKRGAIDGLQKLIENMNEADPTLDAKRSEMMSLQIEYKNWYDLKQAEMTASVGRWTGKIYQEISTTVAALAAQDGIDAVFYIDEFQIRDLDPARVREQIYGRKLIYCGKNADMTQAVLDKLNEAYKTATKTPMLPAP